MRGLSLVAVSRGHSSSWRAGLSLSRPLLLRSTGSRHAGSVVVAHGLSCSAACGIFPDQGSNPRPLHRQADSQLLRHQGSPWKSFWYKNFSPSRMFICTYVSRELSLRVVCRERKGVSLKLEQRKWFSRLSRLSPVSSSFFSFFSPLFLTCDMEI